jgi:hypothetical protein
VGYRGKGNKEPGSIKARSVIISRATILHHGAGYLFWPIKRPNFVLRCLAGATPTPQDDYFHIPAAFTDVCFDLTTSGHKCQGRGNISASVVTNPSGTLFPHKSLQPSAWEFR